MRTTRALPERACRPRRGSKVRSQIGSVPIGFESDGVRTPLGAQSASAGESGRRKRRELRDGEALGGITSVTPQVGSSDLASSGTERPGAVRTETGSATGSSRVGPRRHAGRLGSSIRRRQSEVFGPKTHLVSAPRAESRARKRRRALGSTSASVGDERGVRRRRWPLRWTSGRTLRRSTERAVTTKVIERQGALFGGLGASALTVFAPTGQPACREVGSGCPSGWLESGAVSPRRCEIGVPSADTPTQTCLRGPPRGGDGRTLRWLAQLTARPGRWHKVLRFSSARS